MRSFIIQMLVLSLALHTYAGETVIISDVDDTIKITQIHSNGYKGSQIKNLLSSKAFTGIPELFRAVDKNDAVVFYYLSGAPKQLKYFTNRFLRENKMPRGKLFLRPNPFRDTVKYKIARAQSIMAAHPNAQFILIGDNGQDDDKVYQALLEQQKYPIRSVFMHKLYDFPIDMDVKNYSIYVTSAELAIGFYYESLISRADLKAVLETVLKGLTSNQKSLRYRSLPTFVSVNCEDAKSLLKLPSVDEELMALVQKIYLAQLTTHKGLSGCSN